MSIKKMARRLRRPKQIALDVESVSCGDVGIIISGARAKTSFVQPLPPRAKTMAVTSHVAGTLSPNIVLPRRYP